MGKISAHFDTSLYFLSSIALLRCWDRERSNIIWCFGGGNGNAQTVRVPSHGGEGAGLNFK